MKFGCVLMAAGTASRFGENKLLHPVEGQPMVAHVLSAVPACLFTKAVAVVSTPEVRALTEAAGYETIINEDPGRGQGSTVALGAAAMAGMDAVLFCVGDQPYLTQASVRRLLDAYTPGAICSLAFGGKRGNPVLFPRECVAELAALLPDEAGRTVMMRHENRLRLVEAQSARELFDIDTPGDLAVTPTSS